ncbi:MAG: endo-1,4-beta-xylanase [Acidimicrobiales bacterium]
MQNPDWLTSGTWTRDEAIGLLEDHIDAVAGRYAGRIVEWDVVNEAVGLGDDPWPNPWSASIGYPDYLDVAFHRARLADPSAQLFYNDFGIELANPRRRRVRPGARHGRLRADRRGRVPGPPQRRLVPHADKLHGRAPHRDGALRGARVAGVDHRARRRHPAARRRRRARPAGRRLPAGRARLPVGAELRHRRAVGVSDAHSWIPGFRPGWSAALLLDEQYQPKPAYDAVAALLADPPARLALTTTVPASPTTVAPAAQVTPAFTG